MPGKVFIKTFGCQMNEYDSAKMADVLRDVHGMEPAAAAEDADVPLRLSGMLSAAICSRRAARRGRT